MLTVKNLTGETEPIAQYKIPSINERINGNLSLSFIVPKAEANAHAYSLIEEESTVEYEGITYRVKQLEEKVVGQTPVKYGTAPHIFFDLVDDYRYTTLSNGYKAFSQVLSFIFAGTDWEFAIIGNFTSREFENFGNDNCIALFNKALERYNAEFEIVDNVIIVRPQVGGLIDFQFRYNHNVKTLKKTVDTANLSTYIRGVGKQNEDGTYVVEAEYTSPMADIYGIRHAPPYSNDTILYESTLLANMKRVLDDMPKLMIELEFAILKDAGYTAIAPKLGDIVPTIYEPLNIDVDLRIVEIERYPESNKSPRVVLANTKRSLTKTTMSYQKALLDRIWDENSGKIRYDVYSEGVQRATEALNNSLTELEYPPGMGIIARDPNDANKFVVFRSSGIGVTTNGGLTFDQAITALGVNTSLLTAGQIFTNNIQIIGESDLFYWDGNGLYAIDPNDANKYVRLNSDGLYIAKGALTIERPDGFKSVNNGMIQMQHAINTAYPEYYEGNISREGFWLTTTRNQFTTMGVFFLNHISRYAVFSFFTNVDDSSATASVRIRDMVSGEVLGMGGGNSSGSSTVSTIQVDLGVPTGSRRQLAVDLRTTVQDIKVRARIFDRYLEG